MTSFERAAGFDGEAHRAAAHRQARHSFRSLRRKKQRRRGPDVGTDDMGRTEVKVVNQRRQKVCRGVWRNEFGAVLIGMAEARHVERDDSPE